MKYLSNLESSEKLFITVVYFSYINESESDYTIDGSMTDVETGLSKLHLSRSFPENGKRTSESSGSYTVSNSAARLTFNSQRKAGKNAEISSDSRRRVRPGSSRSSNESNVKQLNALQVAQNSNYSGRNRITINQKLPAVHKGIYNCNYRHWRDFFGSK